MNELFQAHNDHQTLNLTNMYKNAFPLYVEVNVKCQLLVAKVCHKKSILTRSQVLDLEQLLF